MREETMEWILLELEQAEKLNKESTQNQESITLASEGGCLTLICC